MPVLNHSVAEVTIWNSRRLNGPYKSNYDTRIKVKADDFKNNASTRTAEIWLGNQVNAAWDGVAVMSNSQPPNVHPSRTMGDKTTCAALVGLMLNDTSYTDLVASNLLSQIAEVGTDFTNTTKWPTNNTNLSANNFQISNFIKKLAYAYSYIENSGSLTAGNKTAIKAWLGAAGNYWMTIVDNDVEFWAWPNRDSDIYTIPNYNPGGSKGLAYFGGPTIYQFHNAWVNISCQHTSQAGISALVSGDTALQARVRRFFEEWVTYAISSNGTVIDIFRWNTVSPPDLGAIAACGYFAEALGPMVAIADSYARNGDTSWYTFATTSGLFGWNGGPKSIGLATERICRIVLGERGIGSNGVIIYGSTTATADPSLEIGPHTIQTPDVWMCPSNVYFKNPIVKESYTRPLPSTDFVGGFNNWGGEWGCYPDVLFMYGQTEDLVNPYNFPVVAITDVVIVIHPTQLVVTFTTDVVTSSFVNFGTTASYGMSTPPNTATATHTHTITGLTPYTLYHLQINAGGSMSIDYSASTELPSPTNVVLS